MSAQQCRLRPRWGRPSTIKNGGIVVGHDDGSHGGVVGKDGDDANGEKDASQMVIWTAVLVMNGDDVRWRRGCMTVMMTTAKKLMMATMMMKMMMLGNDDCDDGVGE